MTSERATLVAHIETCIKYYCDERDAAEVAERDQALALLAALAAPPAQEGLAVKVGALRRGDADGRSLATYYYDSALDDVLTLLAGGVVPPVWEESPPPVSEEHAEESVAAATSVQEDDLAWAVNRVEVLATANKADAAAYGTKVLKGHGYPNETMSYAMDALALDIVLAALAAPPAQEGDCRVMLQRIVKAAHRAASTDGTTQPRDWDNQMVPTTLIEDAERLLEAR